MKDLIPGILPPSEDNWRLGCTIFNLFPAVRAPSSLLVHANPTSSR
jgi:hypothetical protein